MKKRNGRYAFEVRCNLGDGDVLRAAVSSCGVATWGCSRWFTAQKCCFAARVSLFSENSYIFVCFYGDGGKKEKEKIVVATQSLAQRPNAFFSLDPGDNISHPSSFFFTHQLFYRLFPLPPPPRTPPGPSNF